MASELSGCSVCVPAVNWLFFLHNGRGFGGMQLRYFLYVFYFYFLVFLGLRKEVTMSLTSCYQIEMYLGWAPDEGK